TGRAIVDLSSRDAPRTGLAGTRIGPLADRDWVCRFGTPWRGGPASRPASLSAPKPWTRIFVAPDTDSLGPIRAESCRGGVPRRRVLTSKYGSIEERPRNGSEDM